MGAKEQGADPTTVKGRWQVVPRTLCFVTHGDDILLMKRAPHRRIFPNHYNGVGGHIERGEDPHSGAVREIKEETGLDVINVQYCGSTHIDAGQETGIVLFVFTAEATSRDTIVSEEGTLHWLSISELLKTIQSDENQMLMVEDLPIVLPLIFEQQQTPFFAHVSYDDADQIQFRIAGT